MKNNKHPITDVYLHPDLIPVDIRPLVMSMTRQQFTEFYSGYLKVVKDPMEDPYRPKTALRYPCRTGVD